MMLLMPHYLLLSSIHPPNRPVSQLLLPSSILVQDHKLTRFVDPTTVDVPQVSDVSYVSRYRSSRSTIQ